jgi:hypothetical protein
MLQTLQVLEIIFVESWDKEFFIVSQDVVHLWHYEIGRYKTNKGLGLSTTL